MTAGDLHGQGRLDLVAGDSAGRLGLYRDLGEAERHIYAAGVQVEAGGAPFQVDPGPDGMLEGPVLPRLGFACPLLVDWTGNGRLDLIVSGAGGEVLFLRNDGSSTDPRFGVPTPVRCEGQALIIPPRVRPAAADLSGEGRLDLIALDLQGFLCVYPRIGPSEVGRPHPIVDRLGRYIRIDGGFGLAGRCSLWAGRFRDPESVDLLIGIPRANRHVVPAVTGRSYDSLDEISTVLLLSGLERGVVTPRALTRCDGSPLVFGYEGCSPSVVYEAPDAEPSLLVGCDDGSVDLLRREELAW